MRSGSSIVESDLDPGGVGCRVSYDPPPALAAKRSARRAARPDYRCDRCLAIVRLGGAGCVTGGLSEEGDDLC